ncbi:MAG: IS66 family transposase [Kosmotogaceae bacterium]
MTAKTEQFYIQRIADLEEQLKQRDKQIAALIKKVEQLTEKVARLSKNSSNSSKPPSSDIVKHSQNKKGSSSRNIGGQPGHTKHERPPFTKDEINYFQTHTLDVCPDCGGKLNKVKGSEKVVQQVEIVKTPIEIEQHTCPRYWCQHCQKSHYAPMPAHIEKGQLIGPRLTAVIAYMKGACHCSFSTIRKFIRDVAGITISRGQLSNLIQKASAAFEYAYNELAEYLPNEAKLNIDETGHKENKVRFWTWCFRAEDYTFFKIAQSRGSKVIIDTIGKDFAGIIGCDYFSAYRKYMKDFDILVQFCLAHLIRELKYLAGLTDKATADYGQKLLDEIRQMFNIFHKADEMTAKDFAKAMEVSRKAFIDIALKDIPDNRQAQNLANRFREHGDSYFRFITTPGIEPTNNLAEQAIRFVVIDRYITQGTRSENGRAWCERIWTVLATCTRQGKNAFEFIYQSIQAHFNNLPLPSLLGP